MNSEVQRTFHSPPIVYACCNHRSMCDEVFTDMLILDEGLQQVLDEKREQRLEPSYEQVEVQD